MAGSLSSLKHPTTLAFVYTVYLSQRDTGSMYSFLYDYLCGRSYRFTDSLPTCIAVWLLNVFQESLISHKRLLCGRHTKSAGRAPSAVWHQLLLEIMLYSLSVHLSSLPAPCGKIRLFRQASTSKNQVLTLCSRS